jgi:hypothetical protein
MRRADLCEAAQALVHRTTVARGLPTTISDPTVLARVAGLFASPELQLKKKPEDRHGVVDRSA